MATVKEITKYDVSSTDLFFFDNNIWVFLFAPIAGSKKEKQAVYASFVLSSERIGINGTERTSSQLHEGIAGEDFSFRYFFCQ